MKPLYLTLGLILAIALAACSDDSSGSSAADAPVLDTGSDASVDGPAFDQGDADASFDLESGDAGERPIEPPDTIGGDRPALVRVPDDYAERDDWPLVIVLHGYSAAGLLQDAYFGLSVRRSRMGFVLVLPDGTTDASGNRFWNAFFAAGVDDIGYLTALIDEAAAELRIDPERVYLVGHSNGAFMAHRMACDVGDRVTAIAALAGTTFQDVDDCDPSQPMSVLQIHGTFDVTVAYDGGNIFNYDYPGAVESSEQWRDENNCAGDSVGDPLLDYDTAVFGDETAPERWPDCDGDALVELWTMTGSGHIPAINNTFRDDLVDWLLARRRPAE